MMNKILNTIESQKMSVTGWILGFLGIFFIRFMLESLSSPSSSGVMPLDPQTVIHYFLFFLCTVLATALVVGYTTENYIKTLKLVLFGLPVIWVAPIIDFVLSLGDGYKMTYIFDTHSKLIFDFFTFFGGTLTKGATYGIRFEILIVLIAIGWYVWREKKSIYKTFLAVFVSYLIGFILATLPGIIYSLFHSEAANALGVLQYFEKIITQSNITHNTLHEGATSVSSLRFFELGFNKLFSQILFIMSVVFSSLLLWKINSKKFFAVIKNIRVERINFYISTLLCGVGFAYLNKMGTPFVATDVLGILCLIISWVALWMHAVHLNDVADLDIDRISNTERPLVKKELDDVEMKDFGNLWLTVALLGSWCAGFYPFFMSLIYVAASYIYSVPPLRLRRFPLVPSFLIGVACLATVWAGFFFVSQHKELQAFPPLIAFGIIIIVSLAINFKDLKDIEGDRENGIITLATIFGEKAYQVIGLLLALSILLTPFFLSFYLLYIFAIPAAIISYKLVTKKPYIEKHIFILRFIFLVCIGISYIGVYFLANLYNLI